MSKCAVCGKMYHPDYITYQERMGDTVKVCAFCKIDKDTLTITDDNGKIIKTIKKEDASREYMRYLDVLSKKPNIAKILDKSSKSEE